MHNLFSVKLLDAAEGQEQFNLACDEKKKNISRARSSGLEDNLCTFFLPYLRSSECSTAKLMQEVFFSRFVSLHFCLKSLALGLQWGWPLALGSSSHLQWIAGFKTSPKATQAKINVGNMRGSYLFSDEVSEGAIKICSLLSKQNCEWVQ